MAISATRIFEKYPESLSAEARALLAAGEDPFGLPGLHVTRDSAESTAINHVKSGAVILAGSGMATGGRVLHHLRHHLWRHESSVIFVGYAATGTLARHIINGAKEVRIFGGGVHVAARIYTIGGFSAHADQAGLLRWHSTTGSPTQTFLVHGEEGARQALATLLHAQGRAVELPHMGASYQI